MVKRASKKQEPIKLDLSFGVLPPDFPFKRLEFDPRKTPWPLKDASVAEAYSAYLLSRIPGERRGAFMDELWRVLLPGAQVTIVVPYWSSARAVQDPFTAWPPLVEQSFLYFNKNWRKANNLDYAIAADFDFSYGYTFDPETQGRSDDTRPFWVKHYLNAAHDLQVVLTKRVE